MKNKLTIRKNKTTHYPWAVIQQDGETVARYRKFEQAIDAVGTHHAKAIMSNLPFLQTELEIPSKNNPEDVLEITGGIDHYTYQGKPHYVLDTFIAQPSPETPTLDTIAVDETQLLPLIKHLTTRYLIARQYNKDL